MGTQQLAEKARHAREAHEHVKATSYYLECARAGASFLSQGRWGLNDALKSAREGLKTLNLAQQPGCARPRAGPGGGGRLALLAPKLLRADGGGRSHRTPAACLS